MQATYNPSLVALSVIVAVLVSYTALSLSARVAAAASIHVRFWLAGGAVTMGVGIWSMHFIGMMAFTLPVALRYDVPTTLLSLAVAIVTSGCALWIAGGQQLGWRRLSLGALLMGMGISAMHYSGMSAIQIVPSIGYDPLLVAYSVGIAIVASFVALWLAFNLRTGDSIKMIVGRLAGALVMGAAISGMHYTGMAASRFSRDAYCIGGLPIDNQWLAMIIGLITVALLAITLITTIFDAHLQSQVASQAQRLKDVNAELLLQAARAQASEERLRQIADNIPAMVAYWDRNGICRFANKAHFERLGLTPERLVGMSLDEVFAESNATNSHFDAGRRARIDAALRGERQLFDQTDIDADGTVRHSQSEFLPHWVGDQVMGFYALSVDITQRKPARAAGGPPDNDEPHGGNRRLGIGAWRSGPILVRHGVSNPRPASRGNADSGRGGELLSRRSPRNHRRRRNGGIRRSQALRSGTAIHHRDRASTLGAYHRRAANAPW